MKERSKEEGKVEKGMKRGGGERRIEIKGSRRGKKAARKLSVIMEDENKILNEREREARTRSMRKFTRSTGEKRIFNGSF